MEGWIIVQSFINLQEAYMAKAYLESAGLETWMQDEMMAQTGCHTQAIGGIKLLVRHEACREALEILEKGGYIVRQQPEQREEWVWVDKQGGLLQCPFCHSEDIGKCKNPNVLSRFVFLILGVFSPLFRPTWKCHKCGKVWKFKS